MNKTLLGAIVLLCGIAWHSAQPVQTSAGAEAEYTPPAASAAVTEATYAAPAQIVAEIPDMERQIDAWVREISGQSGFEAWREATWERMPLGPGTHAWIVNIRAGERDVGYLIVGSTPEGGIRLEEYGLGEYPLFSLDTLHRSLMQAGLIPIMDLSEFGPAIEGQAERLYIDALHAVWKISIAPDTYYVDAKTGELLPLDYGKVAAAIAALSSSPSTGASQGASIVDNVTLPVFDPFYRVNWLTHKPVALEDHRDFRLALHHETEMTYTARLFQNAMLCAFAVTGYQEWADGLAYTALESAGARYIPYELLAASGSFFQ